MSDLSRAPGTQLIELGEGLLSLGSALGGAANNLQRQADAKAAERQAELDAANKVLLEVGTYNQAGKAQMDYQNGMNSWFLEMRGSGETDPKKWSEAFMEAHNKYTGAAKENITLPQAQIQFDKFIADEFNSRQKATQDYVFTQFENQAKGIFEANRSSAVAMGDVDSVTKSYAAARAFLSPEQIMKQDDDVAQAKYNKVFNGLSTADPQFALDLLGNEKNAKAVGIDLSVLTPEQLTKMTEDFQKKRDYGEGVLKKTNDVQNGKKEESLAAAENSLLSGNGNPSTWLSWDMIDGFVGPDAGSLEVEQQDEDCS
jgi:hypothetical protein